MEKEGINLGHNACVWWVSERSRVYECKRKVESYYIKVVVRMIALFLR